MDNIDALRDRFDGAYRDEFLTEWNGAVPLLVQARLNEATRQLHAAEDPWGECLCYFCRNRDI